jgi:uroporphyrinogen-III decarboxylase
MKVKIGRSSQRNEKQMKMTSRERFWRAINKQQADRVCVDFGATPATGIMAGVLHQLRYAILKEKNYRVKICEPMQMLGEIDDRLREALGIDVVGIFPPRNILGFENKNWKPFTLFNGTEVLVPGGFNVKSNGNGGWLIYPQGDMTAEASGIMPKSGYYFDAICRQEQIVEEKLNPAENIEDFEVLSSEDIKIMVEQADRAIQKNLGTILNLPCASFGDVAYIPAPWAKKTKGIRNIEEWYISIAARRNYVYKVFEGQCEIALRNLKLLADALGDRVQAVFTTGTDFGTQRGLLISPATFRQLFKPFHKIINDYIHKKTKWKIFIHSCGAVSELMPDFIDAGFDIFNPVQSSAAGMEPAVLKKRFGRDLVFWGGGIDTQKELPFGTADEVYGKTIERIKILNNPPGFVFSATGNIQTGTAVENILAMFRAIHSLE